MDNELSRMDDWLEDLRAPIPSEAHKWQEDYRAAKDFAQAIDAFNVILQNKKDLPGFAAYNLASLGRRYGQPVVQRLIAILCQPKDDRRGAVAKILADIGKPSIPSLVSLLSHTDKTVRQLAVYSLGQIGEKGTEIPVEPLFACLGDSDKLVRGTAAVALGRYSGGSAALTAMRVRFPIEPLLDSLKDSDAFVRDQAAWALGEIGDSQALPALEKIARSDKKWLFFPSHVAETALVAVTKIRQRNKAN